MLFKIIGLLVFLSLSIQAIPFANGSLLDVSTCAANITDDGGAGDYTADFSGGIIIRPDTVYKEVGIVFNSFNLGVGDTLKYYPDFEGSYAIKKYLANISVGDTLKASAISGAMKIEFMSDASNESTGFDFDIYCKKADLTISNLRVDHYGTPRDTLVAISNIEFFNLSYDVQIVDAQARFNINWYLSHDSILDVTDSLLGEETDFGSNIWSPQDLNDFSLEVPIPYVDSAGKYFIIGEIDPENYTIESDETNNLLVKEVEITKIIDDSVHVYGDKNLTTCNDTIYDHNKEGLYSYGLTSTMTVSPTEHQTKITRLTFLEFDLEDGVDFLIVNGDSLTGSNLPSTIYGEFDGGAKGIDLHFFSSS
jgi:hypothetical protein